MVTRKSLNLVAQVMSESRPDYYDSPSCDLVKQWRNDVEALVKAFTQLNPRFDADLFRRECNKGQPYWSCRTAQ